jgi:hypothetical protein
VIFEPGCRLAILPEAMFDGCSSLQSIRIPSSIDTICVSCFAGCGGLKQIIFDGGGQVSDRSVLELDRQCYGTLI